MTSSNPRELVLFDIPSKGQRPWSLNPWKARLILNYKNIPYRTHRLEYPEIAPTLSAAGVPPNPLGSNPAGSDWRYSVPAIKSPDGRYVMDSLKIARVLEVMYAEPPLLIHGEAISKSQELVMKIWMALGPIAMPRIPSILCTEEGWKHYRETRVPRFGMSLEELAVSDLAGENAWRNAEAPLEELRSLLEADDRGPYVAGERVGFGDFIIVGLWICLKRLESEEDLFGRIMADETLKTHTLWWALFYTHDAIANLLT